MSQVRRWPAVLSALLIAAVLARCQAATGTISDVQHVVILMQEGRSFDHYFGAMGGVRGFSDRNVRVPSSGLPIFCQPFVGGYLLPYAVPSSSISLLGNSSATAVWDSGKWDNWLAADNPETMSYNSVSNLEFYYALAKAYTVCDASFASVLGGAVPNRLYLFSGTIDPNGLAGGPALNNQIPTNGYSWTTYPELLQAAGISWKVYRDAADPGADALAWFSQYRQAAAVNPLYSRGVAPVASVVGALAADVTNGTLPQVSWICPPPAANEQPPTTPGAGAVFVQGVLAALRLDTNVWNSTVFILTYDDNGGFFDHVPPPTPPLGTPNEYVGGLPIGMGARVPMIIVSPWTKGGRVCSQVFDHTSILRFLETWTGVVETNLSAWRRQVSGDLTSAFNFAQPNAVLPTMPTVADDGGPTTTPAPPLFQSLPAQDANSLLALSVPYQPEAWIQGNSASGQIQMNMTNSGADSVHLAVYNDAVTASTPRQYDVGVGGAASDFFAATNGYYALSAYGPNGFQRQYAGNLALDSGQLEATAGPDVADGVLTLTLQNFSGSSVNFSVASSYGLQTPPTVSSNWCSTNLSSLVGHAQAYAWTGSNHAVSDTANIYLITNDAAWIAGAGFNLIASNAKPFAGMPAAWGLNHVNDLFMVGSNLCAEDLAWNGDATAYRVFAQYDPATLGLRSYTLLPQPSGDYGNSGMCVITNWGPNGGTNGVIIEGYYGTNNLRNQALYLHDLSSFQYLGVIPLSRRINNIQGLKYNPNDGYIYVSCQDVTWVTVYAVSLTGQVYGPLYVFGANTGPAEAFDIVDNTLRVMVDGITADNSTHIVYYPLAYVAGERWTNVVPPGSAITSLLPAGAVTNGWYDLTVTTQADARFVRHFAGRVETGAATPSEPPRAAGSTSLSASQSALPTFLAAAAPELASAGGGFASPAVSPGGVPLLPTTFGGRMVLVGSATASNTVVQGSPTLSPASWSALSPSSYTVNVVSNCAVFTIPLTSSNQFFRLGP